MTARKEDVLDVLRELRELTLLEEGDPQAFRVRAYDNAISGVEGFGGALFGLSLAELQKISGVGKSTAEKIAQFLSTGRIDKLEGLRAAYPRSVVDLLNVPGLGPKSIVKLRKDLGIESRADLARAIADGRLRTQKGFGIKTEEKLRAAMERMDRFGDASRLPISVALPLAERLVQALGEVPGVAKVAYAGSLRRFQETIGDIDLLVVSESPAAVIDAFVGLPMVETVLVRGDKKTSVVTRRGTQVDLRVVLAHQWGAALMYFTGSKTHNVALRERAIARGMTLNEYGLTEVSTGRVVASETEVSIYEALGLPWIHPTMREDQGEIELAAEGALPTVLSELAIRSDFHVHTDLSGDGRSPLGAMISAARDRGYARLAITEHAAGIGLIGVSREALLAQRAALEAHAGGDLRLLHGVELNIGRKGELDYDEAFRATFDYCLASIHDGFDLSRDEGTERLVTAMRDPHVRMIGHLSARMIGARPPIEFDLERVLDVAEETGTAIEINGGLPRLDASLEVIRRARGRNIPMVLTSDAHHTSELGRIDYAATYATRGWLSPDQVVNFWPEARVSTWLAAPKRS